MIWGSSPYILQVEVAKLAKGANLATHWHQWHKVANLTQKKASPPPPTQLLLEVLWTTWLSYSPSEFLLGDKCICKVRDKKPIIKFKKRFDGTESAKSSPRVSLDRDCLWGSTQIGVAWPNKIQTTKGIMYEKKIWKTYLITNVNWLVVESKDLWGNQFETWSSPCHLVEVFQCWR